MRGLDMTVRKLVEVAVTKRESKVEVGVLWWEGVGGCHDEV